MQNTTMRILINSDDRKVETDTRKIPLSNLANPKNPFGAAAQTIDLQTPAQNDIVRAALLQVPIPPVYVRCDKEGTYTFLKGQEYVGALLGALKVAEAEKDIYHARRLGDLMLTVIRFHPMMDVRHCQEIIRQITSFGD